MSETSETDALWDAQIMSDTPYHEAWEEMSEHACKLERERADGKKQTQQ